MKLHYSYHVTVERKERFTEIMTYLNYNIGYPVATQPEGNIPSNRSARKYVYQTLTSEGIIIIWNEKTEEILTIYAARMRQALAMYKQCTKKTRLPQEVFNALRRNERDGISNG